MIEVIKGQWEVLLSYQILGKQGEIKVAIDAWWDACEDLLVKQIGFQNYILHWNKPPYI